MSEKRRRRVKPRLSQQGLLVLKTFLDAAGSQLCGADIMAAADLPSGTVYPILRRFERAGFLNSVWEDASPTQLGRPRRRLYALTSAGREATRDALSALTPAVAVAPATPVRGVQYCAPALYRHLEAETLLTTLGPAAAAKSQPLYAISTNATPTPSAGASSCAGGSVPGGGSPSREPEAKPAPGSVVRRWIELCASLLPDELQSRFEQEWQSDYVCLGAGSDRLVYLLDLPRAAYRMRHDEQVDRRLALALALEKRGERRWSRGNFGDAMSFFDRALQHVGYRRPRTKAAAIARTLVVLTEHYLRARRRARRLSHEERRSEAIVAQQVFGDLTYVMAQRSVPHCVQAVAEHLAIAERIGEKRYLALAQARAAMFLGLFSLHGASNHVAERARATVMEVDDPVTRALVNGHVGSAYYFGGRLVEAEHLLLAAVNDLDAEEHYWYKLYFWHNLDHTYSVRGDNARQLDAGREQKRLGKQRRDPEGECWGESAMAISLARQGDHDAARCHLARARALIANRNNIVVIPAVLKTHGLLLVQAGEYAQARRVLADSVRAMRRHWTWSDYTVKAYPLMVEAILGPRWFAGSGAVVSADAASALRWGRCAARWSRRSPNHRPHALRAQGRAAFASGHKEAARNFFCKAVDAAADLGAQYELALAHIDRSAAFPDELGEDAAKGRQLLQDVGSAVPRL